MYSYRNATLADYSTICDFPKDSSEVFFMCPKLQYPLTSEQLVQVTKDRMNQTDPQGTTIAGILMKVDLL